ncbi:hypothetical protein ACHAWO_007945 [Cyclotella atomus]|uniref:MYND-type domain-containing protein n=1 Tax=Cyclotella atomus TaxID=382360 RepID=A0ABD3PBQ5_9STRA
MTAAASTTPPKCGHCSTQAPSLLLCTGCRHTHYCNSTCQASARRHHKSVCSPRILRVASEDAWQAVSFASLSAADQTQSQQRETEALAQLARCIIETKIRPSILREDVIDQLADWLRLMLLGPALPYNKVKNFERDILNDEDLISDAEIYMETLPGCHASLIERNRGDERKKHRYPDPSDELRVSNDVLRIRCGVMVAEFAKRMKVSGEALQKRAMEEFYLHYRKCLLEKSESGYNSYTGMSAMFGDVKFMKRSEEIVMFALGLSDELRREDQRDTVGGTDAVTSAPPPRHTLIVFTIAMTACLYCLPSLQNLDEYATVETFTTSIFREGTMFHFSPSSLGLIRCGFACIAIIVAHAKWKRGVDLKLTYLAKSKLRNGRIQMSGWRTQGFFTAWSWNLLGISFFLAGLIPLLAEYEQRHQVAILANNPWILRAALISFEIAAPCALFISFIVTYSLWPTAYNTHGPTGSVGFKSWVSLFQHNVNTFMVLIELCLMGGLPVKLSHASFAPLYAGTYQIFMWLMARHWVPSHGPLFLYFFVDTTLGKKTTYFMLGLFSVIFVSFLFFACLELGVSAIEHSEHGVINLGCVLLISWLLMKFND